MFKASNICSLLSQHFSNRFVRPWSIISVGTCNQYLFFSRFNYSVLNLNQLRSRLCISTNNSGIAETHHSFARSMIKIKATCFQEPAVRRTSSHVRTLSRRSLEGRKTGIARLCALRYRTCGQEIMLRPSCDTRTFFLFFPIWFPTTF